ncbi:hypothetical protein [Pseudomonas sp.]|uniref:hypothetical protein n=1 Tax=Pseudomonas sp. TaxID=306 RepID=UPI0025D1477B|nr:hypothetical protein [Pseudomonas sp.]
MAAGIMEKDGTSGAVEKSKKSSAFLAESVSLVKLRESDADPRGVNEKFSRAASVSSKVCYADILRCSSGCNKAELSADLELRQTLFVSSLIQQLRPTPEVLLSASAFHSELTPATFPNKVRAEAAAPRVTEFRRVRRHLAGRQRRHHESCAPRRAGSQG